MVTGWLLKIVLTFVVVGLLIVEAGSPFVTKMQVDDIAHEAAELAAFQVMQTSDAERARTAAETIVADKKATLKHFEVLRGEVKLTVERQARSILLKKWKTTESWYDVEVTVTASTEGNR